ncbi:biotin--[acetyl-CoA-carboxylase] ligase [Mameliella sediminis]|uniref:biotin--[acetyl-CoA-carboxylase] ligase n=1 Tax=Mameliella sediminis TaxID=2836866 RepID=UPI001C45B2E0|nr:biotin--[acetyl-CoA-carboxylase] ligase [Mameliella sediminis]MBY6115532.1 biotin--[acetyl-CoA-carboxylase] ligase [Antarctobacter heliothermus]MBY6145779.1 biotin--[acetyl-CoA-carboxylase] ligase [Mameliella alba]MBV7393499.1 biotin--[acetyl-CoA-carboxylase] ligase [Mameliella sediminis]MBY6161101.1 biotin--[acetyl-CoA-carboxylase] ligase [Mameliella alba]MBY6169571.1 biotin--[acetyl-CoA-carboxylase] ligase [Mameliella alba]
MGWPSGYGRRVLAEVDSTNAEAARIAGGLSGPEWILGLRQTAARGRRGRAWVNPAGNFAGTLVLRPDETADKLALRSFVASLALYDALASVSGTEAGLALKWPNDVLLNGGKLAGILLEGIGGPGGHLAIGIGVNLLAAPGREAVEAGAVAPVSLLEETGVRVLPEVFLDALAEAYAVQEERFVTYGFDPIRSLWLSRAARLGEVIVARTSRESTTGVFETVDGAGQLVLKTPKGRVTIAAADIFFE